LIRRLILETGVGVSGLDFPAAEGTAAGGWDGVAQASGTAAFIPDGLSLWELSVSASANSKAEADYVKRLTTPDGSPTADATYNQVILRRWEGRRDFAKRKNAEGRWRRVNAYGVDDIETWLESAPVTHAWISEYLGLAPYGMQTADAWWDGWASATTPALTTEIVLAGRHHAAATLSDRLSGSPEITTVLANSRDEALAFIASVVMDDDASQDGSLLARTAFVDDLATWRMLAEQAGPLILVPRTPEVIDEAATARNHHVVVPLTTGSKADVVLPPIGANETAEALAALGLDGRKADEAGRLARRSLLGLRRHLANKPELHQPAWSQPPVDRVVRGILLASQWSQADGDAAILEDLTGETVSQLREGLALLAAEEDPVVDSVGGTWTLTSPDDAWMLLQSALRADDLVRLRAAVLEVLLEPDPREGLSEEERLLAPLRGKVRRYSSDLRHGLARTLALLGTHGNEIDGGSGTTGEVWADRIVREVLQPANDAADSSVWASIADLLPLLAEASPDSFIAAVRAGVQGEAPVLAGMFRDAEDGGFLSSHSPHSALLWALEVAAWSRPHFGAAVDLIARLEEIDPGGKLGNRPFRSLENIFCSWHPDNSASWAGRLSAIDGLRQRHPKISWRLMLQLLPDLHAVHHPTSEPRFRDWVPESRAVGTVDYLAFVNEIAARLREDAGLDVQRWIELTDEALQLGPDERRLCRDGLNELLEQGELSPEDKLALWRFLRDLIAKHREFNGAEWALPEAELTEFDAIADAVKPDDSADAAAWLFAEHMPTLGSGETRRSDFAAYREALGAARRDALTTVVDSGGLEAVRAIVAKSPVPSAAGVALAQATTGHDDTVFALLDAEKRSDAELAGGFMACRFASGGWEFVSALLDRHQDATPSAKSRLLLATGDYPRAWEVAAERGDEVARSFWDMWMPHGLGPNFAHVDEAGEALLKAGRDAATLELVGMYLHGSEDDPKYVALAVSALTALSARDEADPEMRLLSEYVFAEIFRYLERHRDVAGVDAVAKLEWAYLPALGFEPNVPSLHSALADDPGFFVEIMKVIYQSESEESATADTDKRAAVAMNGYRLLSSWRQVPGLADGVIDVKALNAWVSQVLQQLDAAGRRESGERQVGQMLASAPADADGCWPSVGVRDLLETVQSGTVDQALATELYNRRGTTMRSPEDGGAQELALAEKYATDAEAAADRWPRTAEILRSLAKSYKSDARQYEAEAERRRRGID
jgi:hypothetical protein